MCIKEVVKMSKILLVIDVQEGFMNKNTETVYKKIVKYLWDGGIEYNKVVFTKYINNKSSPAYRIGYDRMFCGKEIEIYNELREWCVCHRELYKIFRKDTYSCWYSKNRNGILFTEWLKENRITDIDICGVESNCCVLASAFDLFDNGYKVNILLDKCANMNGTRINELMVKEMFVEGKVE